MHQIRFLLGLRPRHRWGAHSAPPDPLAGFKGAIAYITWGIRRPEFPQLSWQHVFHPCYLVPRCPLPRCPLPRFQRPRWGAQYIRRRIIFKVSRGNNILCIKIFHLCLIWSGVVRSHDVHPCYMASRCPVSRGQLILMVSRSCFFNRPHFQWDPT